MKIRNGFVSNSSSSSFVVKIKDWNWSNLKYTEEILDSRRVGLLRQYGFLNTEAAGSSDLYSFPRKFVNKDTGFLGYHVACNEHEVMEFLVLHNIPFDAFTSYGLSSVFYDEGSEEIIVAANYGVEYEMYKKLGEYPKSIKDAFRRIKVWDYFYMTKEEFLSKRRKCENSKKLRKEFKNR